ncbi:Transposon Ty3-G Gag-Pol polyprotein [Ceratobasidium sp. AG-Ba]|nr:Transposon Ty3-G Gag-Pol polyprotein [Ceratobasidium sp. AG-Ba]
MRDSAGIPAFSLQVRARAPVEGLTPRIPGAGAGIRQNSCPTSLPKTIRVHNVFHINLLSPVTEDKDFHRKQVKPPPIITEEGEEEYEVDHVVNWEWRNGRLYYQIRWKGYDPIEDTMERAKKFAEMHDLLADLRKCLPGAPMPNDSKGKTKSSKQKEGRSIKQGANEGK